MTETPSDPVDREPQSAPAPPAEDPPEDPEAPEPTGRGGGVLRWIALILLLGLAGIQGAGVLLRDHLEGRRRLGGLPPPAVAESPAAPVAPAQTPGSASRFGPDVREVAVARPPAEPRPATAPAPEAPAAPAVPPVPGPRSGQAVSSSPAPETPTAPPAAAPPAPPTPVPVPQPPAPVAPAPAVSPATPPAPAAAEPPRTKTPPPPAEAKQEPAEGTHVLQMGVFRSQKYRRELEEQLTALGVPHYRTEGTGAGAGYRLTVPTPDPADAERASGILDAAGYAYRPAAKGIEVRFFLEEEAQTAMDLLAKAGFRVGYMRVEGDTPIWTVFAGPYDLDEAKAARERLSKAGLDCYLRRRP